MTSLSSGLDGLDGLKVPCLMNTTISPLTSAYLWFRPQRGSFVESMEEARAITDKEDLARRLGVSQERIEIKYLCWDCRNDWATHIVAVDGFGVGFTNGDLQ